MWVYIVRAKYGRRDVRTFRTLLAAERWAIVLNEEGDLYDVVQAPKNSMLTVPMDGE